MFINLLNSNIKNIQLYITKNKSFNKPSLISGGYYYIPHYLITTNKLSDVIVYKLFYI